MAAYIIRALAGRDPLLKADQTIAILEASSQVDAIRLASEFYGFPPERVLAQSQAELGEWIWRCELRALRGRIHSWQTNPGAHNPWFHQHRL
jgi:hypothetical protein